MDVRRYRIGGMEVTVLCDTEIRAWALAGGIAPFNDGRVNPASIDLCWSGRYRKANIESWSDDHFVSELVMLPGVLYLLDTLETVSIPASLAGMLALKSSLGRQGLEHLHAGWFDPGFHGTATLEVKNMAPWQLTIQRGQPIVQMALLRMSQEPQRDYTQTGRYAGQQGPTLAR